MKVGFIGLGAMGLPMAKNVVKHGHQLYTMVHRNPAPGEEMQKLGAVLLETPAAIAEASDVVITIVPADAQLKEVVLGPNGLKEGLSAGKALIDMTSATGLTLSEIERELSGMDIDLLDAPVSGGTPKAASGELTIIVGGKSSILETYRELLETMGSSIYHVGPIGSAKVVKMVNQLMAAIHILTIGEAFALGKKAGADVRMMYEVIKDSSGYSRMMDLRLPGFLMEGKFEPGFTLDLMKKDVGLATDSAEKLDIPLQLGSLAMKLFQEASDRGRGVADFSASADYLANLAGVSLASD